jgi:hypothetical protein
MAYAPSGTSQSAHYGGTAPSVTATIAKVGEIAREANRYAINFLYNQ